MKYLKVASILLCLLFVGVFLAGSVAVIFAQTQLQIGSVNISATVLGTGSAVLTIDKICTPSDDGGHFDLQINGVTAGTGTDIACGGTTGAITEDTGSYVIGEAAGTGTDLSNYTATFSGDCDSSGNVTLNDGDNKTCTIINTRIISTGGTERGNVNNIGQGYLKIISNAQGGDGTTFNFNVAGSMFQSSPSVTIQSGQGEFDSGAITTGTYNISEAVIPGWNQISETCDNNSSSGTATIINGQTTTCMFTNAKVSIPSCSDADNAPVDMSSNLSDVDNTVYYYKLTGVNSGAGWGGADNSSYTYDSNISAMAVHSGAVANGSDAIVKITLLPGQNSYTGSTQNGVTTYNYNP